MSVINGNAELLRSAVDQGINPITVDISDAAQARKASRKGMGDKPCTISLSLYSTSQIITWLPPFILCSVVNFLLDISARFGGDCTAGAIQNRFKRIKKDAVLINQAVAAGIDVITINVGDTSGANAIKGGMGQKAHIFYMHIPKAHSKALFSLKSFSALLRNSTVSSFYLCFQTLT